MRVICTAGHVDHGKSTLVTALTGMAPDRFAEEQRRGLTIDLGFAWTRLGPPAHAPAGEASSAEETIAFVDLPGHERFIANMLAGAGPVELALFVVAADEGWMPQSQEHLEILDLLGVSHAVVAVTKADAVDPETLQTAVELVRHQLAGTTLDAAEIVVVSAQTGLGVDALRAGLWRLVQAAPAPADLGRPRLWVDRVFTAKGAGTVVTGTLSGGRLRTGAQLAVLGGTAGGRIRALQSLGRPITEARPGSRVAVNLSGVHRDELERGDALGIAGQWLAATSFDAWVRALPGREIDRKGDWHLHIGSAERLARVAPVLAAPVRAFGEGDGPAFARIELDRPVTVTAGDVFVLRESGRRATVGGGQVLDPDPPPRPRGRAARSARHAQLLARRRAVAADDRGRLLALHIQERAAAPAAGAAAAVGLTAEQTAAAAGQHALSGIAGAFVDRQARERWGSAAAEALRAYQREHPLERAAPRDVAVRAAVGAGCPHQLAPQLLDALVADGVLAAAGPGLRTPEHQVRLDPAQSAARDGLLAALDAAGFTPPGLLAAAHEAGADLALVRELEAEGSLVRLGVDLAFTAAALDAAVDRLRRAYKAEGPLTAARAKEVLGTSRKYALPLLEELDRRGRTRRIGDTREVLG